ncbi:hypothetical protein [Vulgatibacter incomptus]|uniref:Cytochrome c domain-containing protein n=1 Tax=Vulgatibacter incomptus TaxID=1391653 RepID=A0A0K1PJ84_9BACT|nr:hypothetical protein [Vulgatibacter incomptus]AKU93164.1 hypothetical protein AKJ08_3551 [Vulgatibacter incomptus]
MSSQIDSHLLTWSRLAGLAAGALLALAGCSSSPNCDDLLPAGSASFRDVAPMFTDKGPKGCAQCHNTKEPVYGLNFEGPAVTYDALNRRFDAIYDQVETGSMPRKGERWTQADLKLLRSWYCQGAIYETP